VNIYEYSYYIGYYGSEPKEHQAQKWLALFESLYSGKVIYKAPVLLLVSASFLNENTWSKNGKANVMVRLTHWLLVKPVGSKMPPWP